MDEFKTNICNALMKQSLTLIDNCLNNKRNYNLKIQMKQKPLSLNLLLEQSLILQPLIRVLMITKYKE